MYLEHNYEDLITIFNQCFAQTYNTRLVRGEDEPIYLPADKSRPYHTIYFAHGFFSSALHEIAHWLIAGENRRLLVDFGYWYEPDGRSVEQQQLFEKVEAKPQALEWILSDACDYPFQISVDNLNGPPIDMTSFKEEILKHVSVFREQGLPERAALFQQELSRFYL